MHKDGEWFVIVNPNAGRRKGEKDWLEIARLMNDAGIRFTNVFTEHPNHAVRLARKHIEGERHLYPETFAASRDHPGYDPGGNRK
jgi:diacylglycerol kinase family enzyme